MDDLRFTSFSTAFQSYQDDGQMKMKSFVQWNPFTVEKIMSPRAGLELGTSRLLSQRLNHFSGFSKIYVCIPRHSSVFSKICLYISSKSSKNTWVVLGFPKRLCRMFLKDDENHMTQNKIRESDVLLEAYLIISYHIQLLGSYTGGHNASRPQT